MKLLLSVLAICSIQTVSSTFCFWNTGCPYKYFSNKTPYNSVRGDIRDSVVKLTGCEPVSIWGLIRHGQRNPGTEFGKHMKEALVIKEHVEASYNKGNCSLCAQDVENLLNWQVNMEMFDKPFQLTKEGYQESEGIGRRFKQAFPKLLEKLDQHDYLFRPAQGAWMADSAKGFVKGLGNKDLTIQPPKTNFDILSPYDTCKKYITDVKGNPETYAPSVRYLSSSEYLASKDRIQRRLGINYILTDTNITALYDLCRYTTSGLENKLSPWCALFTTQDLKVLEYIADLRHYYKSGYGTPINELLGQITLTDLLKSFKDAKSGKGKKITSYVTHATMMDMVYTALQLFKDDEPLSTSQRKADRKWRSSKLAVFSSNLMAVLNKCDKAVDDYNVVFYFNEEPLQSICREGVCTWQEFEDKLSPFTETNTEFCHNE
nr:multiple inositol polyphosphate phosphatase 1 [Helicoverpa armigera]